MHYSLSSTDKSFYPAYPAIKRALNHALIVDDDINIRAMVSFYFKGLCELEIAENSNKALRFIKEQNYDLILMDIELGYGMNGIETTRVIRDIPKFKNIPIIAITACAQPDIREQCLKAGMDAFLPKPFFKHTLLDQIENVLKAKSK